MNTFEVIIIGGGTAGLMLARDLGKLEHRTLVLERKENLLEFSFNTLGSFMNLNDFNLSENVVAQKIDGVVVHSKRVKEKLKLNGYILDKKKVHEEILESIDGNFVKINLGINITDIAKNKEGRYSSVIDKKGNQYKAKIFVDASGTNGVISKKVGLGNKKINLATGVEFNVKYIGNPNEAHLLIGKVYQGGYGWIFPLKNGRAIIGFGTYDKKIIKGIKDRLNKIIELPNIKKLVIKDNDKVEGGSIPLTPVLDKFIDHNLVCVGDSVSQVNPIVGEGYKFIFESALMASKSIDESLKRNDLNYLSDYEISWRKRFLLNYKRSKKAQSRIYRYSKSDFLTDIGTLMLKLRSTKKNAKTLSGEYE
ncbi:MAG: NAD(P)/FAD-dependent oxidoreductase [Flavobacteriaceae bacterium]|nr:NAD(P)/FAD-dependent oxidoreductase [Flavobacteriaceae bacterium]